MFTTGLLDVSSQSTVSAESTVRKESIYSQTTTKVYKQSYCFISGSSQASMSSTLTMHHQPRWI